MVKAGILALALVIAAGAAAFAQDSNCLATLLGQTGCGAGMRPSVQNMGDTLGSRGGNTYLSDPDPTDDVNGAWPYSSTMGEARDLNGKPLSRTLGGSCDPLKPWDCN